MKETTTESTLKALKSVADFSGKSVLEVGCGEGELASQLSEITGDIIAIDPDTDSILSARLNYPTIDFQIGNGCDLSFSNGTFDFVLFTLSLHHQDSKKALAEAARVLKKGGSAIIVEPVIGGDVNTAFKLVHDEDAEKQAALDSIHSSVMKVTEHKEFSTDYVFDSKLDLYDTVFGYYGRDKDLKIIEQIDDFFGERINAKPLCITHLSHIYVLIKSD